MEDVCRRSWVRKGATDQKEGVYAKPRTANPLPPLPRPVRYSEPQQARRAAERCGGNGPDIPATKPWCE